MVLSLLPPSPSTTMTVKYLQNPAGLPTVQMWVVAVLSLLWAAPQMVNQMEAIKINLEQLIYLSTVATAIVTLMITIAQRWVSAQEVAVLLSLEPVFGAIFAFWLLGETFGIWSFVGAAMILTGIFIIIISPAVVQPQFNMSENLDN
jgi:drug/metabolite transporter (DMT)-like permease